jgi:hypothetical protein
MTRETFPQLTSELAAARKALSPETHAAHITQCPY